MKNFFNRWGKFLSIILSPGAFVPMIVAGLCLYFAFTKDNKSLSVILSITASLLMAIAGVFIKDDWDRIRGDSILEKKGRSAIRNLDSIGQQIGQLRNWIKDFCSKDKSTVDKLEEVDRHLSTAQMNITSGLEDWIDIIPELRERKETIDYYESTIKTYVEEVLKSKKELATSTEDKKGQVEQRIKDLEKSLKELKSKEPEVLAGGVSTIAQRYLRMPRYQIAICNNCQKQYPKPLSSHLRLCSQCRNKE